jgi:type II secretory pathway component PulK
MVRQAHHKNDGVALLIVVFVIALLAAVAIGMLELNTEDIQLVQNQINAAQAVATTEAGLNDALSRIRQSGNPNTNISSTPFNGGSYTVTGGSTITSIGTTAQGFTARVDANITIGTTSPYIIRINKLCINNQ